MKRISRRALLTYTGLGAVSVVAGCSQRRAPSADAGPARLPHTYGYHPYENGIPAKGHSMTYLIVCHDGAIMVDPGRGTCHNEIIAFIHAIGLQPSDVRWALLTHAHLDHTAGAHLIQAEGIPIAASAFTARAVHEAHLDMSYRQPTPESSCEVDRILNDNDILEVGDMRVRIIATPGHTAGCISALVDTDEGRTVFTGDLIRDTGQPGWTGSPSFALDESIKSIEKLLALKPDKAYWGHGEVDEPAQEWLQRTLDMYRSGKWIMD